MTWPMKSRVFIFWHHGSLSTLHVMLMKPTFDRHYFNFRLTSLWLTYSSLIDMLVYERSFQCYYRNTARKLPLTLMAQRAVVQPRKTVVTQFLCVRFHARRVWIAHPSFSETAGLAVMCSTSGEVWIQWVLVKLFGVAEAFVCDWMYQDSLIWFWCWDSECCIL